MAGGQPREGAEGAAGGAPALGRGPGPGARAALGFRGGDVVMTPRGRRAKVAGCVHGPGGSRLWAEYLGAFPPRCHLSLVSRLQRSSSPPPATLLRAGGAGGGGSIPFPVRPYLPPPHSSRPPNRPARARSLAAPPRPLPSLGGGSRCTRQRPWRARLTRASAARAGGRDAPRARKLTAEELLEREKQKWRRGGGADTGTLDWKEWRDMERFHSTGRVASSDKRLPREEAPELSRRGFVLPAKPVTNSLSARRFTGEGGSLSLGEGPPSPMRDIKISADVGAEGPELPRFQDFSCRPYTHRSVFKPLPPEQQTYVEALPEAAVAALAALADSDGDADSGLLGLRRGDEIRLPTGIMAEVVGASYQPLPEGTQVEGGHLTEWRMWAKTKRFGQRYRENYLPLDPTLPFGAGHLKDRNTEIRYKKTLDAKKVLKSIEDMKGKWSPYGERPPPKFELSSRPAAIATRCGHGARGRAAEGAGGGVHDDWPGKWDNQHWRYTSLYSPVAPGTLCTRTAGFDRMYRGALDLPSRSPADAAPGPAGGGGEPV